MHDMTGDIKPVAGLRSAGTREQEMGLRAIGQVLGECLFDSFPEHCYLLSEGRRILAANDTAIRELRTSSFSIVGAQFHPMLVHDAPLAGRMLDECSKRGRSRRVELRFAASDGRHLRVLTRAVCLPPGQAGRYLLVGFNVSGIETRLRQSRALAMLDPLTLVYNRRYLERFLRQETSRGRRYAYPTGFIMADIDHFKQINDLYGHCAGDDSLRYAARRLANALRASDTLVRYGGDEFLAILPQTGAEVDAVVHRIRGDFSDAYLAAGNAKIPIRISIGASVWSPTEDGRRMEDAIHEADKRLYDSRRAGQVRAAPSILPTT